MVSREVMRLLQRGWESECIFPLIRVVNNFKYIQLNEVIYNLDSVYHIYISVSLNPLHFVFLRF